MVVELLGVRLIAPVFGTGFHVWASLISVALFALAVGYFAGGWLADRFPRPAPFFGVLVAAGVGVLLIPLYATALIPAFESAGLRLGALLAATVTFLPPLFLLGLATPYAIRLSAQSVAGVGSVAGRLYAVSTCGSVAGTLLTGFLLAPVLEIDTVLRVTGAVVVLLGVIGLAIFKRRGAVSAAVLLLLLPAPVGRALPPGEPLFSADTPYQRIDVVDRDGERWMYLDGCVHTHMTLGAAPRAEWGYIPMFRFLPDLRSEARTLLAIGIGGGALFPLVEPEEYEITAVEIDPVVASVAGEYFKTLGDVKRVEIGDGRPFVRRTADKFDLVAVDVVGADLMPDHLITVEFFRELKRVMSKDGVVALNSIGARKGRSLASLELTLSEVFKNVDGLATNPDGEITNVIFYASDGPLQYSWVFEAEADEMRIAFGEGQVLRDALNPFNFWNAPWSRMIRANRAKRY
jgi:spermidine synthase